VFDDPNALTYLTAWLTAKQNGEKEVRIISALKAVPRERALYETAY
jgi:uncharacterized DUF497 family protein